MGSIAETAVRIRDRSISAAETVERCLDRIDRFDGDLSAFLSVDAERARSRAGHIDERIARGEAAGPLAGVPLAVKDNICTMSVPTTCGSRMLDQFVSLYSAEVVDRLEGAGAVVVGKTNLDEFGMGSSTENSGYRPTRNPWDRSRVPGGSSGGSAAAVAARLVPGALGSDTGGSVRQPASLCGVTGLKPTYGRVSRYGLVAFGSSLDQVGTLTEDAEDAALLLSVLAGHDPRDSTSVDRPAGEYVGALDGSMAGLRIGVCPAYMGEGLDDGVRRSVESALDVLKQEGATVCDVELPHARYAVACYYIVAPAEASSNLARFDGVRYGLRCDKPGDIMDLYCRSRGEGLGPEVKRRIMIGTYVLSSGYYDAYYQQALKVRTLIRRDFERAFERVDVLATPVSPTTAFALGEKRDDPLTMYLGDVYTICANLTGVCAVSIPCGFDRQGLPIGLQLMAPAFGEETLLGVAHQFQRRTDYHGRVPKDYQTE